MTPAEWRPVPGFDGYEVSQDGDVRARSWLLRDGRRMPAITIPVIAGPDGLRVTLYDEDSRELSLLVSDLVARAFGTAP